ncbi:unnamed protein product [Gordionus sp. m RMFG-2023]
MIKFLVRIRIGKIEFPNFALEVEKTRMFLLSKSKATSMATKSIKAIQSDKGNKKLTKGNVNEAFAKSKSENTIAWKDKTESPCLSPSELEVKKEEFAAELTGFDQPKTSIDDKTFFQRRRSKKVEAKRDSTLPDMNVSNFTEKEADAGRQRKLLNNLVQITKTISRFKHLLSKVASKKSFSEELSFKNTPSPTLFGGRTSPNSPVRNYSPIMQTLLPNIHDKYNFDSDYYKNKNTKQENKEVDGSSSSSGRYSPRNQSSVPTHIDDIVPKDEYRIEEILRNDLVGKLISSDTFKWITLIAIIINALIVALQTNESLAIKYHVIFLMVDSFLVVLFVWEILLKWYYSFSIFWCDAWNVFDFIVVFFMVIRPIVIEMPGSRLFLFLRVFKAVRILRIIGMVDGLKVVVDATVQSIPDVLSVVLLISYLILILSICGVKLFGEIFPQEFGDLSSAAFSVFTGVTQNGWLDLLTKFKNETETGGVSSIYYGVAKVYFGIVVILGGFILTNLLVAVVITNLEVAIKEQNDPVVIMEKDTTKSDIKSTSRSITSPVNPNNKSQANPTQFNIIPPTQHVKSKDETFSVHTDLGDKFKFNKKFLQKYPHFSSNLNTDLIKVLEVSLNALDENKKEYFNIMRDFKRIYELIKKLNIQKQYLTPQSQGARLSPHGKLLSKQQSASSLYKTISATHLSLSPSKANVKSTSKDSQASNHSAQGTDVLSNLMIQLGKRRNSRLGRPEKLKGDITPNPFDKNDNQF